MEKIKEAMLTDHMEGFQEKKINYSEYEVMNGLMMEKTKIVRLISNLHTRLRNRIFIEKLESKQ